MSVLRVCGTEHLALQTTLTRIMPKCSLATRPECQISMSCDIRKKLPRFAEQSKTIILGSSGNFG